MPREAVGCIPRRSVIISARVKPRGSSSNEVSKHIWHPNRSQSQHWRRLANRGFQPFYSVHTTTRVPFACPRNCLQHSIKIERGPEPLLQRRIELISLDQRWYAF